MLSLTMLQSALSSLSTIFGGFGVFLVVRSFEVPRLGLQAVLCLGAATVIVLSGKAPQRK